MMKFGGGGLAVGGGILGGVGLLVRQYGQAETAAKRFDLIFSESASNMRKELRKISRDTAVPMTTLINQSSSFAAIFSDLRNQIGEDAFVKTVGRVQNAVLNLSALGGLSIEEAADRMRSAFTSTGESVDQFGLNLRQAEVNAEAQRLGMNKTVRQMSELEKQMVKLSIIQRSFNSMNISFIMMSNTVNQQLTLLWANFRELAAIAGEWSGKIFTRILQGFNKLLVVLQPLAKLLSPIIALFGMLGGALTTVSGLFLLVGFGARAFAFALSGWAALGGLFTTSPAFINGLIIVLDLIRNIFFALQNVAGILGLIRAMGPVIMAGAITGAVSVLADPVSRIAFDLMRRGGYGESADILQNRFEQTKELHAEFSAASGFGKIGVMARYFKIPDMWNALFGGDEEETKAPGAGISKAVQARGTMTGSMMQQQMAYATVAGDSVAVQAGMLELWSKVIETGGSGGAKVKTKPVSS